MQQQTSPWHVRRPQLQHQHAVVSTSSQPVSPRRMATIDEYGAQIPIATQLPANRRITEEYRTNLSIDVTIDFTRPDAQRTRPLLIDGKRLYVDEHYISVWSPILRSWCIECPDRELILANVQFEHVLELLLAIHPTYKDIDDQTVHILLPLAFDYQMEGLLHRCECFLISHKLPFLEKIWLADRYQLNRLMALLLRELKPTHKLDLTGSRYYGLSDHAKVLLLERMHGSPAPDELPEPPVDMEYFLNTSDLNFAIVRAKTGRAYYVNPYYVAAWSSIFSERMINMNFTEEIYCPCSHDELKAFLMAIYPPQLRISETNIAPILMAACRMESQGLLKKCSQILLSPQTQLSVFVRLSLLDRCKLYDMLDQCLAMVRSPEHLIEMTQQQTYDCLSVRAKSAMMDRFTALVVRPGMQPHSCFRCKHTSKCTEVTWMCPQCKTYSSDYKPTGTTTTGQGSQPLPAPLGTGSTSTLGSTGLPGSTATQYGQTTGQRDPYVTAGQRDQYGSSTRDQYGASGVARDQYGTSGAATGQRDQYGIGSTASGQYGTTATGQYGASSGGTAGMGQTTGGARGSVSMHR